MVGKRMASLGYCDVKDMVVSRKSKRTIDDIKDIMTNGNLLSGVLASTPFYAIFGTPSVTASPFEKLVTIREYDWETFGNAMLASKAITRRQIYRLAEPMTWETNGEEQKFWKCVSNASL
ncbi:hypothetical protein VS_II1291 [Vibrio atlanticus]|uniref:Uncharacterized protein n=2 Tax=Vibrio atlanticus TaxID=693153 RepID=B7VT38_VIBA3|nr:hypothetical protein VS_II1291 [Vibrio atlanticus]